MTTARRLFGAVCASFYHIRFPGRISGHTFILRRPGRISIKPDATVTIGEACFIDKGARIVVSSSLVLGDNVYIGKNSTIVAMAPVTIGRGTLVGENVSIHSEDHGPPGKRLEYVTGPIQIGEHTWLGSGVVVLKGVTIGDRTTIGANSVVTRSVASDSLAVGVPAQIIKRFEATS